MVHQIVQSTIVGDKSPNFCQLEQHSSAFGDDINWLWHSLVQQRDYWERETVCLDAAGGVVFNEQNKILLIHRYHKWDLPKGKIEKDETYHQAAIREVEEETGIRASLDKQRQHLITYHIYMNPARGMKPWILKKTSWFFMFADIVQPLKPQAEEEIEKVVWCSKIQWKNYSTNTYRLIRDMLEQINWGVDFKNS